jgi:hypothetical protein
LDASRLAFPICRAAVAVTLAASVLAVLVWAVATVHVRPTIAGETEVIFEASRIREHLPLYVEPTSGAFDYGPVPARFLVTYPPLWSAVVSRVPGRAAVVAARLSCTFAWLAALGVFVAVARRGCRLHALGAAAFFAGTFNIALFADSGRPDSIAILLAAIALARSIRTERLDAWGGALLALAAWVKPTVIGLAVGAFAVDLLSPRRARSAIAGAAAVSLAMVAILQLDAGPAWFWHVVRSNLQPFDLRFWFEAMEHDVFFFVGPVIYALGLGWSRRREFDLRTNAAPLAALVPLATAFVWALAARAKIGSSTNYWMETALGVVAVCATLPSPASAARAPLAALVLAQSLWVSIASVRSVVYRVAADRRIDVLLNEARTLCGARPADVVMSDDPAAELRANGRLYTTAYQMVFLVFAGRYPVGMWIADIQRPEVACFIEHTRIMRFVPELDRAVAAKFEPVASTDDWTVLRARPGTR